MGNWHLWQDGDDAGPSSKPGIWGAASEGVVAFATSYLGAWCFSVWPVHQGIVGRLLHLPASIRYSGLALALPPHNYWSEKYINSRDQARRLDFSLLSSSTMSLRLSH